MSPNWSAAACWPSNQLPVSDPHWPTLASWQLGPRNATFITVRVLATAATAWMRQSWSSDGNGIAPSILFVAGSPFEKKWISSHPELVSGTGEPGASGNATNGGEVGDSRQMPPPVFRLKSLSIASATTVLSASNSEFISNDTSSCPPDTRSRIAAMSA